MAKYRIAWMPGDGVGVDVMDAARSCWTSSGFDAEYIHGDIGWEFWRTEANPLPDRTIEMLKDVDAALFGAITSKPKEEAEAELIPELQGKGHVYRSPIVRLRQEFNLRTNLRPCKAYPGNPLNYRTTSTWSSSARTPRACTWASSSIRCPQEVRDVAEAAPTRRR